MALTTLEALSAAVYLYHMDGDTYYPASDEKNSSIKKFKNLLYTDEFKYESADEDNITEAKKIIEWSKLISSENQYFKSLKQALLESEVQERSYGLIVSSVNAYYRDINRPTPEFVANVDDKVVFDIASYRLATSFKNKYDSMTYLFTLKDKAGNIYVWYSNKDSSEELSKASRASAIIKEHKTFKDTKQNVIVKVNLV